MTLAIFLAVLTFVLSGLLHYKIVTGAIRFIDAATYSYGSKLVMALCVSGIAHVLVIGLYTITYSLGRAFGIGGLGGDITASAMDVFYFSLVTYTSLGLGDIVPTGHLRFIAGIEALNGFLLISCSAAMLFLFMTGHNEERNSSYSKNE